MYILFKLKKKPPLTKQSLDTIFSSSKVDDEMYAEIDVIFFVIRYLNPKPKLTKKTMVGKRVLCAVWNKSKLIYMFIFYVVLLITTTKKGILT